MDTFILEECLQGETSHAILQEFKRVKLKKCPI